MRSPLLLSGLAVGTVLLVAGCSAFARIDALQDDLNALTGSGVAGAVATVDADPDDDRRHQRRRRPGDR
ncbi:hypothetical protein ABI214_14895 [Prescottella soli]|uniref:Uncharacterized protein n=1 Tax=Prescottella soli TaxID=1543852 RepID=A0ABW9FX35_9NOCA